MNEKNKQNLYIFTTSLIIIPATGRFSVGLVIYLGAFFIVFFGTLLQSIFDRFAPKNAKTIYSILIIVFLTAIYNQLVKLYSPLMNVYTDFSMYLLAFSSIILKLISSEDNSTLSQNLSKNILTILRYSPLFLLIFIIRDYCGYGTISFPYFDRLIEINLPYPKMLSDSFFWGSLPFAVIIIGFLMGCVSYFQKISYFKTSKKKDVTK